MLKFDNMTEEKQNELAEIAASHGMSTAHLVEIAQGRPKFGRDEVAGTTERRDAEPDHKIGQGFHFGESRFLFRRP